MNIPSEARPASAAGSGKVIGLAELAAKRDALDAVGKRLVITNGCFDLIHAGHVRYLQAARDLGDVLAVALNGDASVCALKGPGRPLNTAEDRAEVLAALACVDLVTIFEEPRATRVFAAVRPHIYVKGGDYRLETLNEQERAALQAAGAEFHFVPTVPGRSTSKLVERLKDGGGKDEG